MCIITSSDKASYLFAACCRNGKPRGVCLPSNPPFTFQKATYEWQILQANEGDQHTLKPNGKAFPSAMRCEAQKEVGKANGLPCRVTLRG